MGEDIRAIRNLILRSQRKSVQLAIYYRRCQAKATSQIIQQGYSRNTFGRESRPQSSVRKLRRYSTKVFWKKKNHAISRLSSRLWRVFDIFYHNAIPYMVTHRKPSTETESGGNAVRKSGSNHGSTPEASIKSQYDIKQVREMGSMWGENNECRENVSSRVIQLFTEVKESSPIRWLKEVFHVQKSVTKPGDESCNRQLNVHDMVHCLP